MMFERGGNIKGKIGIGKWVDHLRIESIIIAGTIGWKDNTELVNYKFEGIELKKYLKAVEESAPYIRTKKADSIAQNYMRAVFYGKQIIVNGKFPIKEENIRAGIWDFTVVIDDANTPSSSITNFQGKNLSYEGEVFTIPIRK